MGTSLIQRTVRAKSIQDAWQIVYEEAAEQSGHQDGYSGDFNSCSFSNDVTSYYNKEKQDRAKVLNYIEENISRREAWGYCIETPVENKSKVKSTVETNPQKGARKWETFYKAVVSWDEREIARDKSQTACIKKARAYAETNHAEVKVIICKELVEGNTHCATVSYKKSASEKLGLYRFIGLAPE